MSDSGFKGPRPISRRRVFAGIALAIILIALAFWLWIESVTDQKWAAMEKAVADLEREERSPASPRPVLHGTAIEGDAWDFYSLAIDCLKPAHPKWGYGWAFIEGNSEVDRSAVESLLRENEEALDAVRQGVRRSAAHRSLKEWNVASCIPRGSRSSRASGLVLLVLAQAKLLHEKGDARGRLVHLFAASQLARDITDGGGSTPYVVGTSSIRIVLASFRDVLVSNVCTRSEWMEMDRALEAFDLSFPSMERAVRSDLAPYGRSILEGFPAAVARDWTANGLKRELPSYRHWRYAYSSRLMEADAFGRSLAWLNQGSRRKTWPEEQASQSELWDEVARSGNLVLEFSPIYQPAYPPAREALAQLRLLRMAVCFKLTGEIPQMEDPLGTTLLHALQGDRLKVWSVGVDGKDDGGLGEWKPPFTKAGKDIVLDVTR